MITLPRVLPHGALRDVAVSRMKTALEQEREYRDKLNEAGHQLVRRAVFAAYLDLREIGEERRAKALLLSAEWDRLMREGA